MENNKAAELFRKAILQDEISSDIPPELLNETFSLGALILLKEISSPDAIQTIKDSVIFSKYESIRKLSIILLNDLANQNDLTSTEALFELAVQHNNGEAILKILESKFISLSKENNALFALLHESREKLGQIDPQLHTLSIAYLNSTNEGLRHRLLNAANKKNLRLWAEQIEAIFQQTPQSLKQIIENFSEFDPDTQDRILFSLAHIASESQESIINWAILQIFFLYDHPKAKQIIVEKGLFPQQAPDLALYLFFSERWKEYQELDFNNSLLSIAYETGSHNLRKRILDHSRRSGYIEWLQNENTRVISPMLRQLSASEWTLILSESEKNLQWSNLWHIFPVAPPYWSIKILLLLKKYHWPFPHEPELPALILLAETASNCPPPIGAPRLLRFGPGKLNCLSLSPDEEQLAAGGDSSIERWDIINWTRVGNPIIPPSAIVRCLAFDPAGEYLAASGGDNQIRIFRLHDNQLIKTLTGHQGIVPNIVIAPNGRQIYSAGFDGSVLAWRFPEGGQPQKIHQSTSEILSLAQSGQILILGNNNQEIISLSTQNGSTIDKINNQNGNISAVAISKNAVFIAIAERDRSLRLYNIYSKKYIFHIKDLSEQIIKILIDPNERFIFTADQSHKLSVFGFWDGQLLYQWQAASNPIISLLWISKLRALISASNNGDIEIRNLDLLIDIFSPPDELQEISQRIPQENSFEDAKNAKAWIDYISGFSKWRKRHDIEISNTQTIHIGNYDIEI